jgi:hypothetical protein
MSGTSSSFILTCTNQRQQRQRFFKHEAGAQSRTELISPYVYDSSGQLIYTPTDLDMRRKAEILKYQNSTNNFTVKRKWAYLANSGSAVSRACPEIFKETSTTASDVPGKPMMLVLNPEVPLDRFQPYQVGVFSDIAYDSFKRLYDIFPTMNIIAANASSNVVTDIVILNPDNNQFSFEFTIPITITYNANFRNVSSNPINYAQLFIQSARLDVYYSESLVADENANFNIRPLQSYDLIVSAANFTMNMEQSIPGPVSLQQYVGAVHIPPTILQTVTQYVYTCKLITFMGYSEYSLDNPDGFAYRSNIDGGDITNDYPNVATSLTDVRYGTIVNIENIYTTTNVLLENSITNCVNTIYQATIDGNGNPVVDSSGNAVFETVSSNNVNYVPFNISAVPI